MELNKAIEKATDFINEVQSNTIEDTPTIIWDRDIKWVEPLLLALKNSVSKYKMHEVISEQIKRINKLLDDMIDKNTGCINTSFLNKKKEELINKRNCLLVQRATLQQFNEDILKVEDNKVEECWLCKEIETNTYKNESSNKKTRLVFYKETGGTYIIRAWGEDVCEQEITHCPLCGRKLGV